MTKRTLRIGVCGTAHWAETMHLPALAQAPGIELVAVQGRNAERTAALSARFGIQGHADFAAMLRDVDAVAFAAPPSVQAELALQAARAGKALLLEKPPTTTAASAQALLTEIVTRDLPATCFLTRRFIPEMAAFVEAGRRRRPDSGEAVFRTGALTPNSPYAGSVWRREKHAGVWDMGPHALTLLIGVFGPIARLRAERDGEGVIRVELRHVDGRLSRFELDQSAPPERRTESLTLFTAGSREEIVKPDYDRQDAIGRAIAELLAGVDGTGPRNAGARFALEMVPALAAAWRSIESGREESCDALSCHTD